MSPKGNLQKMCLLDGKKSIITSRQSVESLVISVLNNYPRRQTALSVVRSNPFQSQSLLLFCCITDIDLLSSIAINYVWECVDLYSAHIEKNIHIFPSHQSFEQSTYDIMWILIKLFAYCTSKTIHNYFEFLSEGSKSELNNILILIFLPKILHRLIRNLNKRWGSIFISLDIVGGGNLIYLLRVRRGLCVS